jgi:rubrerythrin
MMKIIKLALEKERISIDFYKKLAEKTTNKGLKKILELLYEQELMHREAITNLAENVSAIVPQGDEIPDYKELLRKIKTTIDKSSIDINELELYQEAREIELQSIEFYMDQAQQSKESERRDLFERLAQQEKQHYLLIDNILEFVSIPQHWLENAEFTHLEDY